MKPVQTAETFREMDLIIQNVIKRLYGSGDKESPVKVNKHKVIYKMCCLHCFMKDTSKTKHMIGLIFDGQSH